jgi:hypothetical protein
MGSGGIYQRILNLGTRWRWMVSFTPRPLYPPYPLDRRLGGLQSRSEQKQGFPVGTHKAYFPTAQTSSPADSVLQMSYEGVSKSFRTGHLKRKLQMVQLCATRCSFIDILWVSLVSSAAITLCVASQLVFIVVSVYFVIDSVRKLLDRPSYLSYISV